MTMEFSEHIKTANVDDVVLKLPLRPALKGTLCVTAHHLVFSERKEEGSYQLLLLLRSVDAIEKRMTGLSGSSGTIVIKCKDLRILQFDIPGMEECLNVASSIEALSSLESVTELYPFFHRPRELSLSEPWGLSSPQQQYAQTERLWDRWRLSKVNRNFSVCMSYPRTVIVPCAIDDITLAKAASFRQGGRFPVLCYYHRSNGMVIMRSSQPMTGANRKRCREDELLLQAAIDESEMGYIIDTRSAQQAQQARMAGGGFESKAFYHHWRRLHRHLERGKVLQESLIKLVEACGDPSQNMDRWLSKLENSKWLSHVHSALSTAGLVAECVERDGHSVLVHGFEGTDTTLLVTSLAQLILDPASRTFRGFLQLLEREWVQAGHPFRQRCAHSAHSHARLRQECPAFLLLLDATWQLGRQFPLALEFSEVLLLRLAQDAYASDYGTFLCSSEQERCALQVKENTHCLFQFLLRREEREKYVNPLYEATDLAIWPSVHPQSLQLWTGLFLRWTEYAQTMDEAREEIWTIVKERKETDRPKGCAHTTLSRHDSFTNVENLMDELTVL
ncbi:myotubularin-related protein 9 isoform X2 [Electrophorus electricus]|uniref:Myotubularin phosphatase domain-containing protein n=1 Tax=Electrophorus electricus TaxID=8005 RepID=A0A4W4GZL0_ELEEL|nr:myotubularin-related protein 9 isoform X2 [Electrophorus electricus]